MQILVIFTGGTIGAKNHQGIVSIEDNSAYELLSLYETEYENYQTHFTIRHPFSILSENLNSAYLHQLITLIENEPLQDYDGIIITHGTDTLAFTANALALYFQTLEIPLFLVSSLAPLSAPKSNGVVNFAAAIEAISQKVPNDLYVSYKNPEEDQVSLFYAATLHQCKQLSNRFEANIPPFATVSASSLSIIQERPLPSKSLIYETLEANFYDNLLVIEPHIAIDYRHFDLTNVDCVFHKLYHSGTANVQAMVSFIQRCNEKDIPIFFAPIFWQESYYETTHILQESGARFIYNMSYESALIKLMLALSNFESIETVEQFLKLPRSHEIIAS